MQRCFTGQEADLELCMSGSTVGHREKLYLKHRSFYFCLSICQYHMHFFKLKGFLKTKAGPFPSSQQSAERTMGFFLLSAGSGVPRAGEVGLLPRCRSYVICTWSPDSPRAMCLCGCLLRGAGGVPELNLRSLSSPSIVP